METKALNEYRDKLRENWRLENAGNYEQTFSDFLIERMMKDHLKATTMAGDMGQAFSKIGDLERRVCALKGLFLAMREDEYSDAQKFESEQAIDKFIASTKESYPQYFKDCEL